MKLRALSSTFVRVLSSVVAVERGGGGVEVLRRLVDAGESVLIVPDFHFDQFPAQERFWLFVFKSYLVFGVGYEWGGGGLLVALGFHF